jgi:outer membrane receptor protein involved in Fe transport
MKRFVISVLVCLAAFSLRASAQSLGTSEFYGSVFDSSGALVPGATLKLTSVERGLSYTGESNKEGYFSFANLLPGTYQVEVQKQGFETYHRTKLTATAGQRIKLDVQLKAGSVQETVDVVADAPPLETGNNEIGRTFDSRDVAALPLRTRDYTGLINLSENARTFALDGGGPYVGSGRSGVGTVLGGTRYNAVSISIDGVDDNTVFFNRDNVRPSVEGVEEVRVLSNSPSAEYGRNLGGVVTLVTKSGSNTYHGSLYEFHRDNHMNARNAFSTVASPFYLENHVGSSFGGPIRKDRLFIFGNFEASYVRASNASTISVPSPAFRTGDFAGANVIYDPNTTTLLSNGQYSRAPFPNNVIPAAEMDSVGLTVAHNAWPLGNLSPTTFATQVGSGNDLYQYNVRGDYRISDRSQLAARYSYTPVYSYSGNLLPRQYDGSAPTNVWGTNAMLQHVYNFKPTLFNEFRLGFNRARTRTVPLNFGTNPAGAIGLNGTSPSPQFSSFPSILTSGYYTIGSGSNFVLSSENIYHVTDNFTWVLGRHTFKTGIDYRRLQSAVFGSFVPFGQMTFGGVFSSNPAQPANTGNVIADLFLGYPQSIQLDTQFSPLYPRQSLYGAFFQDEYRVSPRLTLNLGVRYELFKPVVDKYDRMANPNMASPNGQYFLATNGGKVPAYVQQQIALFPLPPAQAASLFVPGNSRSLTNSNYLDFSPRLGFSYQVTDKTVLRGGFGVYRGLTGGGTFVLLGFNAPDFIETFLIAPNAVTPVARLQTGIPNFQQGQIAVGGLSPRYMLPDERTQTSLQWNLTLQQEFSRDVTLELAYLGQYNRNLTLFLLNNQIQNPAQYGAGQDARPVPFFGNVWGWGSGGGGNYNAASLRLRKRFAAGLTGAFTYTFSKSLDNAPGDFAAGYLGNSTAPIDSYNLSREYGPSAFDTKHRITSTVVYELPFGNGRRLDFRSPLLQAVAGGWNLSWGLVMQTGLPVDPRTNTNLVFSFNNQNRPNCVGSPDALTVPQSAAAWFNTAAFANPAQYQLGNCGRNVLRAPGIFNLDSSLGKSFQITERVKLDIRGDAFNSTNWVNLGAPNNFLGNPNFGKILSAGAARQIQVGAHFRF